MADPTRPTLLELKADGLTPEIMIDMIDAQMAMASEYVCNCGTRGDEQERIEACPNRPCYWRGRDGEGDIDAPYLDFPELKETRQHYEMLQRENTNG